MNRKIIIGTRGSDLALWQANYISDLLTREPNVEVELKIISTKGDEIQHLGFDKMEGKGFFTKEIEQALINKEIDVAVHSHKDLETISPDGLMIAAVTKREDPTELLLIHPNAIDETQLFSLKLGAVVGTSAPRRKSQMFTMREDVVLKDLRGNVPTRVGKLVNGGYDAILIAKAGVSRLNLDLSECKVVALDKRVFIPAPAQGVLGIQIREEDQEIFEKVSKLTDEETLATTTIERLILKKMEGGCQIPLGAFCYKENEQFHLWVSHGKSAISVSKRAYLQAGDPGVLVKRAVEILKSTNQNKKVFISRTLHEKSNLKRILLNDGYEIFDYPLITFESLSVDNIPATEWIFFSSKNAVRFYLNRFDIADGIKIGVIGSSTENALVRKGHKVDFVGEGTDSAKIGEIFKQIVGSDRVLFPTALNGSTNVSGVFRPQQALVIHTYKTSPEQHENLPDADVLVFTSPSNVESFLGQKKIADFQKIVAIGKTTANKLAEKGFHDVALPWNPNELAIADTIISLN